MRAAESTFLYPQWRLRRRVLIALALTVGIAGAFVAARYLGFISPGYGPLGEPGGWTSRTKAKADQDGHVMFVISDTELNDRTVVVDSVELLGADPEIEILDVTLGVCPKGDLCDRWIGYKPGGLGFPGFDSYEPVPVEGFRLSEGSFATVIATVTTPSEAGRYRINDAVINYHHGLRRFRHRLGQTAVFMVRD
jgi:hypothetical protein